MNKIFKIFLFLFLPTMIFAGASTEDIISVINPEKKYLASIIEDEAKSQNVNVDLVIAIFLRESQFENLNPNYSNAVGIGQITPAAFKTGLIKSGIRNEEYLKILNDDFQGDITAMRKNEKLNIKASIGFLKWLLDYYNNDIGVTTLSYNTGIGNANAMLNNGKNKVEVKVTQTTWDQGIHYVYDVSEKVKIIKKVRENNINSLTNYDLKLLKNGIDNFENSDYNWLNSLTYLNEFDKQEKSKTDIDENMVISSNISSEDIKNSVTTLVAGLLAIYYMKPWKKREEYIEFYQI